MKHYTIPIFIPELACPFQCIYCNQRIISGENSIPTPVEIRETIESHLSTFKEGAHVELGFFGGNFTGIPVNEQEQLLSLVQPYITEGKIQSIRLSTRPDYITEEILSLLKKYNVKTIELGVQSFDNEVLLLSKRGYLSKTVDEAALQIKAAGFDLGLQMMIGLPGDSKEKTKDTALKIVELGATNTRIYPTIVVKNTELAEIYKQEKYTPLSIKQAVEWTKEPLRIFEKNNVTVLRVGLHPTEGFIKGEDFLEGPFHVSFKELVMTEIWRDILWEACVGSISQDKNIVIYVNPKEINYAIGYHSKNKKLLSQYFKMVSFKTKKEIEKRSLIIELQ